MIERLESRTMLATHLPPGVTSIMNDSQATATFDHTAPDGAETFIIVTGDNNSTLNAGQPLTKQTSGTMVIEVVKDDHSLLFARGKNIDSSGNALPMKLDVSKDLGSAHLTGSIWLTDSNGFGFIATVNINFSKLKGNPIDTQVTTQPGETDTLSSRLDTARGHIDVAASSQYGAIKNAAPDPSFTGPGWTSLTRATTIYTAIVDPTPALSILGTDTPILA